jgi:hypothetical protein
LNEHPLLVLDLDVKAVVRDEVQDGKKIVLQSQHIHDTRQPHEMQRLIRPFQQHRAYALAVHDVVVCNADGDGDEPGVAGLM